MGWVAFFTSFSFLLLSGCATMFADREDKVTIKTEPPGAEVFLGAEPIGKTPLTHTFKRSTAEKKNLNIRKEGYQTKEIQIGTTLDTTSMLNLLFLPTTSGAPSWATDAMTGTMVKYSPDSYYIDLEPKEKKEAAELQRRREVFFAVANHDGLKQDIARGEGEYLSAYHRLTQSPEPYRVLAARLQKEAAALLSHEDGVDFYQAIRVQIHPPNEGIYNIQ